ncbi:MAG TPA: right-handed parallel beta-helix repeat-containing protein [Chthonomonadaceae bacterium]|nr:right-handed parallel beta-helix repeat-containing protein [Chthonomonadaceae bacterium]
MQSALLLFATFFIGVSTVTMPSSDSTRSAAARRFASSGNTTYYVDGQAGSDRNPGTSPSHAWKSLARVNATTFSPGDRILFAGGQTFSGAIDFTQNDSGDARRPILLASFGSGRAILDAGAGNGLTLDGCAYIHVQNLKVTGCGRKNGSDGSGIRLIRTRHVEVSDVEVSGFRLSGVATGGDENTSLLRVHAHDNGFAGISTDGGYKDVPRSRNLLIRDCVADNNPGDPKNLTNHSGNGIVVGGVDGALIEYCEASNNGWDMPRQGNGPVGIWGWNCDRLTIQHCIAHDNKSPGEDGDGFDFDGGVTNSVMQYNLSYNNVGCGYLLCQFPGASPWKNNIVRYNISVHDGSKNFQSGIGLWLGDTGISDALIYNNTIVNPWHAVATLGNLPGMVYHNNIFLADGDLLIGNFTRSRFENNLYWSPGKGVLYRDEQTVYATLEEWAKATGQEKIHGKLAGLSADPKLLLPTDLHELPTDPRKLAAMPYYHLLPGSLCIGAGTIVPDNGGRDLFGHPLNPGKNPSLGACELPR